MSAPASLPQLFPSLFPPRYIFCWAPPARPVGPATNQDCRKEYAVASIPHWEKMDLELSYPSSRPNPQGQPWGRHGHWDAARLSATSGFPPPLVGLSLKSWASALALHSPFSILSPSFSQTPLDLQPWLRQPSARYFLSTPQDLEEVAWVINVIHQLFPVFSPQPTQSAGLYFPLCRCCETSSGQWAVSRMSVGHFCDRAFHYQCKTPQSPLFSPAGWLATFEMVNAPPAPAPEWPWPAKPLADVK